MTDGRKLALFALAMVAVFAAAVGIGALVSTDRGAADETHDDHPAAVGTQLGGLAAEQDGYRLVLDDTRMAPTAAAPLRFRVLGLDGAPVTDYAVQHEKELHLIVVRRDLATYQHLHPVRDPSGTWAVDADLRRAGTYRVFADIKPAGAQALTLGTDVFVGGQFDPQPVPAPADVATVDDYTVTLDADPRAQTATTVSATVRHRGRVVADLEPYLGADAHLVSLRTSDLAYLHNHPAASQTADPAVAFETTFPSPGDYRLFVDFQHRGVVRTAAFTVTVGDADVPSRHESHDEHGN